MATHRAPSSSASRVFSLMLLQVDREKQLPIKAASLISAFISGIIFCISYIEDSFLKNRFLRYALNSNYIDLNINTHTEINRDCWDFLNNKHLLWIWFLLEKIYSRFGISQTWALSAMSTFSTITKKRREEDETKTTKDLADM